MFNKIDLTGIPNKKIEGDFKQARYQLAAQQEQFVVDRLRVWYPEVEWHTMTEFMGVMNPEQNRILGDIVGIRKNKGNMIPDIFIDLKVAQYGSNCLKIGNIEIKSIEGFAYKQHNHYYLMSNSDGTDSIIVSCSDIYNLLFNKTTKCLVETTFRRTTDTKYSRFLNKYIYQKKFEGVSPRDFIPGNTLRKYDLKQK